MLCCKVCSGFFYQPHSRKFSLFLHTQKFSLLSLQQFSGGETALKSLKIVCAKTFSTFHEVLLFVLLSTFLFLRYLAHTEKTKRANHETLLENTTSPPRA